MHLKHNDYMSVTAVIFLIVGVVHLWRAFNNLPLTVGTHSIPVVASWIAGVVALYLAYSGHKTKH